MQRETREAVAAAIQAAKEGRETTVLVRSKSLRKDIAYQVRRALRRMPGACRLVHVSEVNGWRAGKRRGLAVYH